MPIIAHGHSIPAVERNKPPGGNSWTRKQICIGRKLRFAFYGKRANTVEEDIHTVAQHFGVNKTDAIKISLRLMVRAIERDAALPEVP